MATEGERALLREAALRATKETMLLPSMGVVEMRSRDDRSQRLTVECWKRNFGAVHRREENRAPGVGAKQFVVSMIADVVRA